MQATEDAFTGQTQVHVAFDESSVGDATMAPYEITHSGGSVEHWNEEAGAIWMQRFLDAFEKLIWINPTPKDTWEYSTSVALTEKLVEDHMYPLTISGIEEGMNFLSK